MAVGGGGGSAGCMVPGWVLMAQKAEPGLVHAWAGLGQAPLCLWLAAASEFGDFAHWDWRLLLEAWL